MQVEIVNVKMGSACSFEILRGISIQKATKLNVDIAFPPQFPEWCCTINNRSDAAGGMYLLRNRYLLT